VRRLSGAVALASIIHEPGDDRRIREAMIAVYRRADAPAQGQLLVAMSHLNDAATLPFFLAEARRSGDDFSMQREIAVRSYALLADRRESRAMRTLVARAGAGQGSVPDARVVLRLADTANRCDRDLACWRETLAWVEPEPNGVLETGHSVTPIDARKAAMMLARFGRSDAATLPALIAAIDHRDEEVRIAVLYALDHVAVNGSAEAVAEIDAVREREEGRAIWNHTRELAHAVRARLIARAR
jgi:hypothetical protein